MHHGNLTVERLQYHFKNQQVVVFNDNDNLSSILNRPGVNKTMFTEWFTTNQQDPEARSLRYVDFPMNYTWKSNEKIW